MSAARMCVAESAGIPSSSASSVGTPIEAVTRLHEHRVDLTGGTRLARNCSGGLLMNTSVLALMIAVAILVIGGAAWWYFETRRRTHLRQRFGPEYDRTLDSVGD